MEPQNGGRHKLPETRQVHTESSSQFDTFTSGRHHKALRMAPTL